MWYACTTTNMRSGLAEAPSIRYTTCWLSCGNELRLTKATYACFFDEAKGYDTVPHALLLHRLLQCGVTGPAYLRYWLLLVCTRLHPAGCGLGQPSPQRGVAQGCPLSPLVYAIFVDPVLRDMQALSRTDLLWVGLAATRRKLAGQAYAADLAGIAATQQGLQRVVQAVH